MGVMSAWNEYDATMCMKEFAVKILKRLIKN